MNPPRLHDLPLTPPAPGELFALPDADRLTQVLGRLQRLAVDLESHLRAQEPMAVKVGTEVHVLRPAEIRWVEADGDYVRIHLHERRLHVRHTLKKLLRGLAPGRFVRIHKSTVINLQHLRLLEAGEAGEHWAQLTDGTRLRVSESYYGGILHALAPCRPDAELSRHLPE